VRYRLMATYQGSPFEAGIGPTDGDIVLFAACPPPEELGFEPATGHWRKQLRVADVQGVWESRPVGTFRGERCMVLDDLGDRLHIGYLGHDGFKAEQLGYWQVDRGVFELVAPRADVTDILEERTEYQRAVTAPVATPDQGGYQASGSYRQPAGPEYAQRPERQSGQYAAPPVPPTPAQPGPVRASGQYPTPASSALSDTPRASGQYPTPASSALSDTPRASGQYPVAFPPVPDSSTGVALPAAAEAPLPLEAEAMRAASAARRPRQAAPRGPLATPAPASLTEATPGLAVAPVAVGVPAPPAAAGAAVAPAPARRSRAARRRMATERLFADLAALAAIPADSYAVGEAVDGALCLVQTEHGFEVFHSAGGARHELQVFATEEAACFYLFGVLAAEAVRSGSLARVPVPAGLGPGQPETT
jgi:hypothetical protein